VAFKVDHHRCSCRSKPDKPRCIRRSQI
jgi:hypothetical protein